MIFLMLNYINQFISLAPENDNLSYRPEQKPLDSQKDWIILPSYQDVFYKEKKRIFVEICPPIIISLIKMIKNKFL